MRGRLIQSGAARWGLLVSMVGVFALISGLYLPGCSDNPASSLETNLSQDEASFFELPFDDEAIAKRTITYDVTYRCEQELSAEEGGTIEVQGSNGAFSFVVAPNSFPADTVFEIEVNVVDDDEASPTIIYEFKPDGLVFSEPAKLVVSADVVAGLSAGATNFYYLDGNKWVYQGTFTTTDGNNEIVIEVPHFSKWGTEGGGGGS